MIPECQQYSASFYSLHDRFISAVNGLSPASLDWTPVPGTNSLAVLISHTMGSERFLVAHLVGVRPSSNRTRYRPLSSCSTNTSGVTGGTTASL